MKSLANDIPLFPALPGPRTTPVVISNARVFTGPELLKWVNCEFKLPTKWFSSIQVMRQATSLSGEWSAMSGPRNPHKCKLDVIEKGTFADLLLIDGNPLREFDNLTRPAETLLLIMKNWVAHKVTISRTSEVTHA